MAAVITLEPPADDQCSTASGAGPITAGSINCYADSVCARRTARRCYLHGGGQEVAATIVWRRAILRATLSDVAGSGAVVDEAAHDATWYVGVRQYLLETTRKGRTPRFASLGAGAKTTYVVLSSPEITV